MKVYVNDAGSMRLIGRADVPAENGPVLDVPLFGPASVIVERYSLGSVTHLPKGGGEPVVERAVMVAFGQPPEFLPGWQALAS